MSNSVRRHRRQPTRLPRPRDSPGKNTGVGRHLLLQCIRVKSESKVTQSCPTLRDPMDCSLPGSFVHGIFQARVLEWGAIAFSNLCHRPVQIKVNNNFYLATSVSKLLNLSKVLTYWIIALFLKHLVHSASRKGCFTFSSQFFSVFSVSIAGSTCSRC